MASGDDGVRSWMGIQSSGLGPSCSRRTGRECNSILIAEIEECEALHEIPGFVADMDPDDDVWRIGLMDGKPARKDKFYR